MKKLAVLAFILVLTVGCVCSVPKKAIEQVDDSVTLAEKNHMKYIEADTKLSAKDKEDWKIFYKSQHDNIKAIEEKHK